MPPKKNARQTVKDKTTVRNAKGNLKFSNVDKEYFTNQFNAKAKIIARLKDDKITLENNIVELKNEPNDLNHRFIYECLYARKILKENSSVEEKLKAEIEGLKQRYGSMEETRINKLKEKDDEFVKEANMIKLTTAVYAARLNNLEEFLRQKKALKEKCDNAKKLAPVTNETRKTELKKTDENYRRFQNATEKRMLRLYMDVVIHLRKQSTSETNPVDLRSSAIVDEINDFKDMVKWMKKQNAVNKEMSIAMIEKNKRIVELLKSNRKNIDDRLDAYLDKKTTITALRRELSETLADVKNRRRRPPKKAYDDGTRPVSSKPLNAVRAIRAAVWTLDDRVRTTEDVLLKVYDEALDHVEEMKVNNKNCKQKTIERIQKFYEELKPFVPPCLLAP